MITVTKPASVKSSGIQETVSFGIKPEGMSHIFNVLRNQLYSDKILAVMREYSANALDANVEAGNGDIPIVVTLPNMLNLNFKVRDMGFGLSDEDIKEVYAFYGESTKRKSNALIGQLGLGSKSAFAYGDNFVINSFVRGVKNTYNAFIDDSQVGQIAKLNSEKTTEHDGVEIVIGVRREDVHSFEQKAASLFKHFKVKPQILGATIDFKKDPAILSGKDWEVYSASQYAMAVMGNIGYPIEHSSLNWNDEDARILLDYSALAIKFEIGELDVAANRESLQYTKRTIEAIKNKVEKVKKEIVSTISSKCIQSASLFEAKKFYGDVFDYPAFGTESTLYRFSKLIKGIIWRGMKIDNGQITVTYANKAMVNAGDPQVSLRLYSQRYSGGRIKSSDCHNIVCSSSSVLVHNDKRIKAGIVNRVQDLVLNGKKKVYVVSASDADFDRLLQDTGLIRDNFIKMSSLVSTLVGNAPRAKKSGTPLAQTLGAEFTLNVNGSGNYTSVCSRYWDGCDVDLKKDSGVFVEIFRFEYKKDQSFTNPYYLLRDLKLLTAMGITLPKIYGFKPDSAKLAKANKNFIPLVDFVKTEIEKAAKKAGMGETIADYMEYKKHGLDWWKFISFSSRFADKNGLIFNACKQIQKNKITDKVQKFADAASTFGVSLDNFSPSYSGEKLNSEILEKYPAVEFLGELFIYDRANEKKIQAILHYIDNVDKISQQI